MQRGSSAVIHGFHSDPLEPDSPVETRVGMASSPQPNTAEEMRDLLAHLLAGVAGGEETGWKQLVQIERVPTWKYVAFNWLVKPGGSKVQREAIGKAVEIVRAEHPYVR